MRKYIVWIAAIAAILIVIVWISIPFLGVKMITNYPPYTFEKVLSDSSLRAEYGIGHRSSPEDYGFQAVELNFYSLDSTRLNGWYIPAKNTTHHCLVFVHGRTSNRLKTMKYLALVDSFDLDEQYSIFIPDLRNSGKSHPAKTYMGYKFAEDVTAAMQFMQSSFQQDTFMLYGFSMGAMAILNTEGRSDLQDIIHQHHITIERVLLDSPLSNVKATLFHSVSDTGVLRHFFDDIYNKYSDRIGGHGENMKLSALYDANIPMLILQSHDDHTCPADVLNQEITNIPSGNKPDIVYFEGPGHVKLFQNRRTRAKYLAAVKDFLF